MIDTRFFADSSQHRSSLVRSCGRVRSSISLASVTVSFLLLASLCSVSISCSLSDHHNMLEDGRPVGVVANLRCRFFIEAKRAASALYWTLWKWGRSMRHVNEVVEVKRE